MKKLTLLFTLFTALLTITPIASAQPDAYNICLNWVRDTGAPADHPGRNWESFWTGAANATVRTVGGSPEYTHHMSCMGVSGHPTWGLCAATYANSSAKRWEVRCSTTSVLGVTFF